MCLHTNLYTMFTAALFIITKKWKQPNILPLMNGVHKICPSHTTGCDLQAIQRDEALTHTTARVNLENMMLSEGSQTQMATYCTIPSTGNVQNSHIHRDRKSWLPRAGGRWGFRRGGFLLGVMKCPKIDGGHSCTHV